MATVEITTAPSLSVDISQPGAAVAAVQVPAAMLATVTPVEAAVTITAPAPAASISVQSAGDVVTVEAQPSTVVTVVEATTAIDVVLASEDYVDEAARDSADPDLVYGGRAATEGASTAAAVWQILRVVVSTGVVDYADGDVLFDNVWDDRESLSYS